MRPSDRQLLGRLVALCRRERTTLADILLALVEVERRKLHVSLGYSSLFAFATRHLHYSESAAGRRVQAARCVRDCPEVLALLRRGTVSLSTVCIASRVLKPENKKALLAEIAGKSQREVEVVVAQYEPPRRVRDRIRTVNVPRPEHNGASRESRALLGSAGSGGTPLLLEARVAGTATLQNDSRSGSKETVASVTGQEGKSHGQLHGQLQNPSHDQPHAESRDERHGAAAQPVDERRGVGSDTNKAATHFSIQFAVGAEFMRKFEEARALLSGRFPKGATIESVFEAGLDAFLDRNSPARRNERRKAREEKRAARTPRTIGTPPTIGTRTLGQRSDRAPDQAAGQAFERPDHHVLPQRGWSKERSNEPKRPGASRRRAIPAAVRDAIFERDGGCCTFVSVDGNRCGARHDVEIDHWQPVARGGTSTVDNLRLLCAVHNRLEAERVFGATWMRRFGRS